MNGFHWLTWLPLIALAAAVLVTAFRLATRDVISNPNACRPAWRRRRPNLCDDLDDKFARGEIDRAVYPEKRRVLS